LLEGPLTLQDIVEARERRESSQKKVADEAQKVADSELINTQNWLKASKYDQGDELDVLAKRCHEGSCDWIHDHPKIKSWMRQGHDHSILWLRGIPGSGKHFCDEVFVYH
jgi:hypothetical protein